MRPDMTDDEKIVLRYRRSISEAQWKSEVEFYGPGFEQRRAKFERLLSGQAFYDLIDATATFGSNIAGFVNQAGIQAKDFFHGFSFGLKQEALVIAEEMPTVDADMSRVGRELARPLTGTNAVPFHQQSYIAQMITYAQFEMPDGAMERLLPMLHEEAGTAVATELFYRAVAQYVDCVMLGEEPEAHHLAAFVLAIKDIRPDVMHPDMDVRLAQLFGMDIVKMREILAPIKEDHIQKTHDAALDEAVGLLRAKLEAMRGNGLVGNTRVPTHRNLKAG
jgi:hypothetical protein